jgi:two-component system, NtrC family, response regulator AtoC
VARILVVDDNDDDRVLLRRQLDGDGHVVESLSEAKQALELVPRGDYAVVVLDNKFEGEGMLGIDCLRELRRLAVTTPVIVLTGAGHEGLGEAIEVSQLGASTYIRKPANLAEPFGELLQLVHKYVQYHQFSREPVPPPGPANPSFIGNSPAMVELGSLIGAAGRIDDPVLIQGESGTGKDLVARALFHASRRKGKNCLPVNCSGIPEVVEDELFGHEMDAFPGAGPQYHGVCEQAEGGAILLDHVEDLRRDTQSKILDLVENRQIIRRGGFRRVKVDVRVMASTGSDLPAAVKEGKFLEPLYFRLNVVRLDLPPLRQRGEDMVLLAKHFLALVALAEKRPVRSFHPQTLEKITAYPWPGNVRELADKVRLAVLVCRGAVVMPEDLRLDPLAATAESEAAVHLRRACEAVQKAGQGSLLPLFRTIMSREVFLFAWSNRGGNRTAVSELLGISLNEVDRLEARHLRGEIQQTPKTKKTKRSTEKGEGQAKIIAALTQHHQYACGGCLNQEPIGNNELASLAGVAGSTVSEFFEKIFKGHAKYKFACHDAARLATTLKMLNGEFSPGILISGSPDAYTRADDDD